ncbi:uncharacterized protein LOC116145148 [Pistacia vera]|uniref:uncharacterized protein LOC116145148 n=1 Tax=Pistacia vera TaxID=55513 RepID=UPI0012636558|nr:uncharacterized protein LOC116145148 [Pistacia vera]
MRKTRRTDPGRSDASNAQDVPTAPEAPNPAAATSSTPGLDVATLERMIQEAVNRALRRTPLESTSAPVTAVTTNVVPSQAAGTSTPEAMVVPKQIEPIYGLSSKHQPPEFCGTNDPVVAEQWIKLVEKATALFPMTDQKKIRYATYLLRGDAMTWWELMEQTQDTTTLTWSGFKELFEEQYRTADMISSKLQEFISLQQGNMTVKEYSIKFNSLAKFAPILVSIPQTRLERFVGGLHPTIARDVMSGHQPSQTYSEALTGAIRAEVYLRKETKLALSPTMASSPLQLGQSSSAEQVVSKDDKGKGKKGVLPKANRKDMKKKGQQRKGEINYYKKCRRRHRGECLVGTNVCFRCRQLGHIARDCPICSATSVPAVGGMTTKVYNVAQM